MSLLCYRFPNEEIVRQTGYFHLLSDEIVNYQGFIVSDFTQSLRYGFTVSSTLTEQFHFTDQEIEKLYHNKQIGTLGYKPRGIWYAIGNTWETFYASVSDKKHYNHKYKISLNYTSYTKKDKTKVLKITNERTFDKFTLKYGYVSKRTSYSLRKDEDIRILIKWKQVARDYGGIEIIPLLNRNMTIDPKIIKKYDKKFKFNANGDQTTIDFWHYGIDVPSGCVWNPDAIKEIELI